MNEAVDDKQLGGGEGGRLVEDEDERGRLTRCSSQSARYPRYATETSWLILIVILMYFQMALQALLHCLSIAE